jgi:gluconolactonase
MSTQTISASVFSRMPDSLRLRGRASDWGFGKNIRDLDCFLEGPAFDRDGNLYVSDIPFGRILKISQDGVWTVAAEYDGWPNGLALHSDGRIFIADNKNGILSLDPQSGAILPVLKLGARGAFKGINDLVFAANGDLYFTDQGTTGLQDPTGSVYRLTAGGELQTLLDNVPSPNGLALSTDGKMLLLAVTRANQIWRLPLHPDGTTSRVGAFLTLNGGLGPDGLALDAEDGLAIAHIGRGVVWLYDRYGDLALRIECPGDDFSTNLAFGGDDGRTLYITGSATDTIFQVQLPAPGRKLFSHSD